MKIVNYLDATLNLENSTYHLYRQDNNQIKNINADSNNPPSIIKQHPVSIESQLSSLSSLWEIFNDSVTQYQEALDKLRGKHKLKYQASKNTTNNQKQLKRNIIWFNSLYSKNVKTNKPNFCKSYKETLSTTS